MTILEDWRTSPAAAVRGWTATQRSPASYALLVLSVLALWVASAGQKVQFVPQDKAEILERFQEMPASNRDRASAIRSLFLAEGCRGSFLQDQPVEGADAPNIVCMLRGDSDETVIVGAHYDRAPSGGHRMDNWSGAALLPSIYHSLHARQRHHNFIFVAFADKENSLTGSESFAGHLSAAQLQNTEAMINLDSLGLSPTKVWSSHSDKELVQDLVAMEYALKLPASQMDLNDEGETDSEAFASRRIPRITIHSLTQQNRAEGTTTAFRPNNYYDTYRLVCGYLAYLDTILKSRQNQG